MWKSFDASNGELNQFREHASWIPSLGVNYYVAVDGLGLSVVNRFFDELVINLGFDQSCDGVSRGGKLMSRLQDGRVQIYLRIIGIALAALVLILIWGGGK